MFRFLVVETCGHDFCDINAGDGYFSKENLRLFVFLITFFILACTAKVDKFIRDKSPCSKFPLNKFTENTFKLYTRKSQNCPTTWQGELARVKPRVDQITFSHQSTLLRWILQNRAGETGHRYQLFVDN